jgi:transposase
MHYSILALLKLEGFVLIKTWENNNKVFLQIRSRRKTADCPKCSKRTKHIHQYGKWQRIKHLKLGTKQIYLVLRKRRFVCKRCKKIFTERSWLVKAYARKTTALDNQIITELGDLSFKSVKRRTKVSYHSQVRVLKEKIDPFLADWQEEKEQENISLGIDEVSFAGFDFLPTIANLDTKRLKTLLTDDRKLTLEKALKQIPDKIKPKIKEFCLDMNRPYAKSIKKILPHVNLVVDHFHVIQDANRRITEERLILQNVFATKLPVRIFMKNKEDLNIQEKDKVARYFKSFPDLRFYWEAKETLRDIYTLREKKEAELKLETLITALRNSDDLGKRQWSRTLNYWKEPILNYFEKQTTNAYLEGINTKLKLLKRISFGFRNKEVFIRKAILSCLPLSFIPQLLT